MIDVGGWAVAGGSVPYRDNHTDMFDTRILGGEIAVGTFWVSDQDPASVEGQAFANMAEALSLEVMFPVGVDNTTFEEVTFRSPLFRPLSGPQMLTWITTFELPTPNPYDLFISDPNVALSGAVLLEAASREN